MSEAERSAYNARARDGIQDRRDGMSEADRSAYNARARDRLETHLQQLTPEQRREHQDRRLSAQTERRSTPAMRALRAAEARQRTRDQNLALEEQYSDARLCQFNGRIDEVEDHDMLSYLAARHSTSVVKSLLFFHINGGLTKYSQQLPQGKDDLLAELGEPPTFEEKCRLLQDTIQYPCGRTMDGDPEHVDVLGSQKRLHACASCGIRYLSITYEDRYYEHRLDEPGMSIFQLTRDDMEKYRDIPVRFLPVRSVYECGPDADGNPRDLYLHPELVYRATEGPNAGHMCIQMCALCHERYKRHRVYERSIKAGWDFGWTMRIGLTPLRLVEAMLLCRHRLYGAIIQLRTINNQTGTMLALRSNTIVFPQEGDVLGEGAIRQLPDVDFVRRSLKVVFLGPREQFDRLQLQYLPELQARAPVLYEYIRLYRATTPDFIGGFVRNQTIQTQLDALHNELVAGAVVSEDPNVINVHRMAMDDVAHVRDAAIADGAEIPVINDHSLVYDSNTLMPSNQAIVNNIAATVATEDVRVPRGGVPSNDMESSAHVLAQMFPHLFLFGTGFMRGAHLSSRDIRHLLLQFTCEHARETRFLFYTWNRQNIRTACATIRSSVHCSAGTYRRFITTVNDPSFIDQLRTAVAHPEGATARSVTRRMMPFIKMSSGRVPFSPASRSVAVTKMHALAQRFGPSSCFLTVSPDDVHSPLTIRLSLPTTAVGEFPNVDAGLCEALKAREDALTYHAGGRDQQLDLRERALSRLVSDNPVASAHAFQRMMEVLTENLLGCRYSYRGKGTNCSLISKGALGRVSAYGDVIHSQGRGTVHAHSQVFGGLPPKLLEKAAEYPELRAAVVRHLDAMYICEVEVNAHARSVLDSVEARLFAQRHAHYRRDHGETDTTCPGVRRASTSPRGSTAT